MRTVVVFGVFDLLHPGHLYFLREARKHGDHLTVVVTRDTRVRAEKNHTPVFTERERLEMVAALKGVDKAVLGDKLCPHTFGRHAKGQKHFHAKTLFSSRMNKREGTDTCAACEVAHRCGGLEWRVLKRLHPDVVCVGYDQKMEWIKKSGIKKTPKVVRIKGLRTEKYRSRNLLPLS